MRRSQFRYYLPKHEWTTDLWRPPFFYFFQDDLARRSPWTLIRFLAYRLLFSQLLIALFKSRRRFLWIVNLLSKFDLLLDRCTILLISKQFFQSESITYARVADTSLVSSSPLLNWRCICRRMNHSISGSWLWIADHPFRLCLQVCYVIFVFFYTHTLSLPSESDHKEELIVYINWVWISYIQK